MSVEFENGEGTSLSTGYVKRKFRRGNGSIIDGFEMRREAETGRIIVTPYTIVKRKHHETTHTKGAQITYTDMMRVLACRREDLRAKRRKLEHEIESIEGTIAAFTEMATEWAVKRPG